MDAHRAASAQLQALPPKPLARERLPSLLHHTTDAQRLQLNDCKSQTTLLIRQIDSAASRRDTDAECKAAG